jgi:hypothetical protein
MQNPFVFILLIFCVLVLISVSLKEAFFCYQSYHSYQHSVSISNTGVSSTSNMVVI